MLQANACKEEQRPQARCQQFNRVRSAANQMVHWISAEKVTVHDWFVKG